MKEEGNYNILIDGYFQLIFLYQSIFLVFFFFVFFLFFAFFWQNQKFPKLIFKVRTCTNEK